MWLTQWTPGDVLVILKVYSLNTCHGLSEWALLVTLLSGECDWTLLIMSQRSLGNGLVTSGKKPLSVPIVSQFFVAIYLRYTTIIWYFGFVVSYLMDYIDNQLPCWPTHILWKACREMVWGMQIWWGSGTRRFWHTCCRGLENRNTDINLSTCRVWPRIWTYLFAFCIVVLILKSGGFTWLVSS